MSGKEIRDLLLETLKKDRTIAVIGLDGFYFSGADIAINDNNGNTSSFRIAVISHQPQMQFA